MSDRPTPERKGRGLGRGLSALMADLPTNDAPAPRADRALPIETVHPNPDQPRRRFDEAELGDLAASIRARGIIQPIIVRPDPSRPGEHQIVAGERRWRAAQIAGLHEVPVVVRALSDLEVLEIAIVENIQRSDLNPVEEAQGYATLMERFGHTQEQLGQALGRSRSHIANALRLMTLPDAVLDDLREGRLTAGHARALIGTPDPEALARRIIAGGLSVRETEKLARAAKDGPLEPPRRPEGGREADADTRALEGDLSAALRMKVRIDAKAGGEGRLIVSYKSLDDLDDLCQLLGQGR